MKSILISIKPKYVADILNGRKTIEIRRTMPKCDLPIDVYIYCTKDKENNLLFLDWIDVPYKLEKDCDDDDLFMKNYSANGKVVAKFTLRKVSESDKTNCCVGSCLTYDEIMRYTKGKKFYAWHIDNLEIFDKPKELSEFYCRKCLKRPPQSWCYVEVE